MNATETIVEGTLQADGTLLLDAKPNLAPGRVTVMLRQEAPAAPPQEDWWQFLSAARKRMEEAGCRFMNDEEVQAHIDWLHEGDQIDELLAEADQRPYVPQVGFAISLDFPLAVNSRSHRA